MLSTKTERLSANTSGRLARIRLEGWLSLHRPESIADYVDRVFARTVQVSDPYGDAELSSLLIDRRRFLGRLLEELGVGAVCSHLVDALRLAWVFRRHGIPRHERSEAEEAKRSGARPSGAVAGHELEAAVAPLVERFESAADAWEEPERSDFFYWASRLGWAAPATPLELERKAPCDLSSLLRQCDYGETRLGRSQASLQSGLVRSLFEDTEASPDATAMLLAGTLLVETALDPPSLGEQERIANRLFELQETDGAFPGASRHRASCLALVALSRVQAILPHDSQPGLTRAS